MGFVPISIEDYIKKHLKSNLDENEKDLRERLNSSLANYKKGVEILYYADLQVI